jgi:enoyl-CoA hydratase/3-hydroxyacyl-CoA dehydrogenase
MIVGVIGSGAIGPDLAYGFLSALGRDPSGKVFLHDIDQGALDAGTARIKGYIQKGVARGKVSPKAAAAMEQKLVPTLCLEDLAPCDYVLEAASERLPIKQTILRNLEAIVSEDCLIGFATSGLPRALIAAEAQVPARCFVNHPFFPAWRSKPVEVVLSGDEALGERMVDTLVALGKVPIVTADVACFAADDIFCNYCSEAARIVQEGIANPAQVDAIVNGAIGGGGPFNVLDGTRGNLLTVHCQELMRDADTGSPWFEAPAILTERGNGLWHDRANPHDAAHDDLLHETVLNRILAVLFARTYFVVDGGICDAADLNWMTRNALGFGQGLLDIAEAYGADAVRKICVEYARANPGFEVPVSIQERRLPGFRGNVRVERDGGLAVVTIFRPAVLNALDRRTITELEETFQELAADDTVEGIVLTSFGGALAGADITELAAVADSAAATAISRRGQLVFQIVEDMAKPVVAALDGPVLGGGAELSMACHQRVVGPRTLVGQPEVNLGIIPGYGGTQRLPRLIGFEAAWDILRTARTVGAREACALGWAAGEPCADPVAGAKDLIRAHLAGESTITRLDPSPMEVPDERPNASIGHRSLVVDAILRDVIVQGLGQPLAEGLKLEAEGFGRCKRTVDLDIGMKNFLQNGPRVPAAFLHE